jgi:nucleolar pre-ribosomal-associated protein 1
MLEIILSLFKEKFELCVDKGDLELLLTNFYMVRTQSKFMSPVKLLEHANCMFTKLDSCSSSSSAFIFAVLICLYIGDITMEMMYSYLQKADKRSASCLLWELEIHYSDITAIQRVYHNIICFVTKLNLELTNYCLIKLLSFDF